MSNKGHLAQIAEHRGCSMEEARQYCLQVQTLQQPKSSFKAIAHAVQQLGPNASMQAVAAQAARNPVPARRKRGRRRGSWQPTEPPKELNWKEVWQLLQKS